MQLGQYRRIMGRTLQNLFSWKTTRNLLVIESDDWGGIRMPSFEAYNKLNTQFPEVITDRYENYDSLECNDDIEVLFESLIRYKDSNGNHPVLTANFIMGNPNFDEIKKHQFLKFTFEPFYNTYVKYPKRDNVLKMINEGINEKIFKPQLHGRDHVNVQSWLTSLREGDKITRAAFDEGLISFGKIPASKSRMRCMDALKYSSSSERKYIIDSLAEGARLFKDVWGYRSSSFIAPSYVWSTDLESMLYQEGILFLQGLFVQYEPLTDEGAEFHKKYHYTGQRNQHGQLFITRNAMFEPSSGRSNDPVSSCLKEISNAFAWGAPAIICSHRVNYIGSINGENRSRNIKLLNLLLKAVLTKWPKTEFITTDDLGMIIKSSQARY